MATVTSRYLCFLFVSVTFFFLVIVPAKKGHALRNLASTRLPSTVDLSQANCRKSLGMQSGLIEDKYITASSSYDFGSVGPANARIRTEKNGGAWCPRQPTSKDSYEWIQVDLGDLKVITQIETQGRFGSGQGQEYVEKYSLQFKRRSGGRWMKYRDKKQNEIFRGNNNTYIAELREVNPPLVAKKVRVVPVMPLSRTVCLRFELYGCAWRDGVVSYGMPQGEEFSDDLHLHDYTYDGPPMHPSGFLWGGLGQLTDGAEGHSNFRLDPDGSGKKGYEWVGWKNDTGRESDVEEEESISLLLSSYVAEQQQQQQQQQQQRRNEINRKFADDAGGQKSKMAVEEGSLGRFKGFVRILFQFDTLRNFTACRIHCNNMFSKEVRLFKKATLHFSLDGSVFKGSDVIKFVNTRDSLIEFARNVIIPIPGVAGKMVVVDLYHDTRWIMISEVRFESEIISNNLNEGEDDDEDDVDDDDDESPTGSELGKGRLDEKEGIEASKISTIQPPIHPAIHPPIHPPINPPILPSNPLSHQLHKSSGDDATSSFKNASSFERERQTPRHPYYSTALLDKVVGVISGVIVALLFIIIFVIILYAVRKNNTTNNNIQHAAGAQKKNFYRVCCYCCQGKYKVPRDDGAKTNKASLDLSICDSTSWPPSMRKVVSNGNTYSNLSSNGCPGDGLPLTSDDVIWRADRFFFGRTSNNNNNNNRRLPDLPGKLFLESSLMGDGCEVMSTSSTYAIPEMGRREHPTPRQNSFCQSTSSPHLPHLPHLPPHLPHLPHLKASPFSIFIPPPPPVAATCSTAGMKKLQTPSSAAEKAGDENFIFSLRRGTRSPDNNRSSNLSDDPGRRHDDDDDDGGSGCDGDRSGHFCDLLASKLRELKAPLLRPDDVILLQCLGSGEFGKLDLCELRKEEQDVEFPVNNKSDSLTDDERVHSRDRMETAGPTTSEVYDKGSSLAADRKFLRDGGGEGGGGGRTRWSEEKKKKRFLVAVKSLERDADEKHRRDFLSELERSAGARHENIGQLLGVCLTPATSLVYEFTKHGDLVQFLKGCVLVHQVPHMAPEADTLSLGCLTHLGCQVASGMKYLEKCGLVHGDLAARNCLVGPKRLVKICDLARWRSRYREDYYPPHPCSPPLPVRWMAWEAIHLNHVTTSKSDVWSFGVTMWEILSLARTRPYHWMSDEQVLAAVEARQDESHAKPSQVGGSFSPRQHSWQHQQQQQQLQRSLMTRGNFRVQHEMHDFRETLQSNPPPSSVTPSENFFDTTRGRNDPRHASTNRARRKQNADRSTLGGAAHVGDDDHDEGGDGEPAVQGLLLPQPIGCSKEIYDLLIECWNGDASRRPSFADIHLFLMRYIDGRPNTPKNLLGATNGIPRTPGELKIKEHDV